jgi:hypothetical protein
MGAGYYAWSIEHLARLEAELRAEQRTADTPNAPPSPAQGA